MIPDETRIANAADPKVDSTCSLRVAGGEAADTAVVPPAGATSSPVPQVARFQIRRRLGRGSFGSVYLAYDPTLDRELALKVPRDPSPWTRENARIFLDEARLAA